MANETIHLLAQHDEVLVYGIPCSRPKGEFDAVDSFDVTRPKLHPTSVTQTVFLQLGEKGFDELLLEPLRNHRPSLGYDATPTGFIGGEPRISPPKHRPGP